MLLFLNQSALLLSTGNQASSSFDSSLFFSVGTVAIKAIETDVRKPEQGSVNNSRTALSPLCNSGTSMQRFQRQGTKYFAEKKS